MVDENKTRIEDTTSSRGAQWAGAGSLIALAAQSLLNGGIGGILGGGCNNAAAQAGNAAALATIGDLNAKVARLEAEKYSDNAAQEQANRLLVNYLKPYGDAIAAGQAREAALRAEFDGFKREQTLQLQLVQKDVELAKQEARCRCQQNANAIAQIAATLSGITKCIVPSSAVCPQPMPLHNSWTAPAAGAPAA